MEKFYIGMNFGFNASACIISNQRGILAAISQERLNGIKNTKEIPIDAILECCRIAEVQKRGIEIERLTYSHYQTLTLEEIEKYVSDKYKKFLDGCKIPDDFFEKVLSDKKIFVKNKTMFRVKHHVAHLYSAIGVYGKEQNFIGITADGFGDGLSGRIVAYLDGKETVLSEVKLKNSLGLLYQFTTGALGYKMHQHEGKITGLAAYGIPLYKDVFRDLYFADKEFKTDDIELTDEEKEQARESTIIDFDEFLKVRKKVFGTVKRLLDTGAAPKNIAASLQSYVEDRITSWIMTNVVKWEEENKVEGKLPCYLAGGLFANVKLNQRVHELQFEKDEKLFPRVLVSPPMGDEGTAIGAAVYAAEFDGCYDDDLGTSLKTPMDNVLVGTSIFRDLLRLKEMAENNKNVKVTMFDSVDECNSKLVDLLADKKIVCLCQGRMEFGPRALCNRSILYDCTDKTANDWLNAQLGRTEFMPFAPVCLKKFANDLFYDVGGTEDTCCFMTMTLNCKEEMANNYPAACHVDNTARPQFVTKRINKRMSNILEKYYDRTRKKVLINTSFNLHNYPIIEDPMVAYDSWLKSNTHALVIGQMMFERIDGGKY